MKIHGEVRRTIRPTADGRGIDVIDQTKLPFAYETRILETVDEVAEAISTMVVRGAPLIGAAGAWGLALALQADPSDAGLVAAHAKLLATRPTAVNLRWALGVVRDRVAHLPPDERAVAAAIRAQRICDEDVALCRAIGEHGAPLLRDIWERRRRPEPLHVLTHCNAGWLATVDWGTALAPVYVLHEAGIPVHVWVDETRPRNQGASLTAFELGEHGVPHTVIADNLGGHLMQHGLVDAVIVGTDRTTATGDVCNKIGTYLKALAARDNGVPFFVGLPSPTIDWEIADGLAEIPIEERDGRELSHVTGRTADGSLATVDILPKGARVANFGFDVTPARLITALVTERGVCAASRDGLRGLFPEAAR